MNIKQKPMYSTCNIGSKQSITFKEQYNDSPQRLTVSDDHDKDQYDCAGFPRGRRITIMSSLTASSFQNGQPDGSFSRPEL